MKNSIRSFVNYFFLFSFILFTTIPTSCSPDESTSNSEIERPLEFQRISASTFQRPDAPVDANYEDLNSPVSQTEDSEPQPTGAVHGTWGFEPNGNGIPRSDNAKGDARSIGSTGTIRLSQLEEVGGGNFQIVQELETINYLFLSVLLILISIVLLFNSQKAQILFKKRQGIENLQIRKSGFLKEKEFYYSIVKEYEDNKPFIDEFKTLEKKISETESQIDNLLMSKDELSFFFNTLYLGLAAVLIFAYNFLASKVVYLDTPNFQAFYQHPESYTNSILIGGLFLSSISGIKFFLSQGSSEYEKWNINSLLGLVISIINLIACFITIFSFATN